MNTSTSACRGLILAVLLQLAGLSPTLAADLPKKQMSLMEDETGTRFKQVWATSKVIPLNRRYAELDEAEKTALQSMYEDMKPGDEPPFPADGLLPVFNAIKKGMEAYSARGELDLLVDVDSQGRATHVSAHGKVDPDMAKFAARVLMATSFKPAVCSGQPCKMQYLFQITFAMR